MTRTSKLTWHWLLTITIASIAATATLAAPAHATIGTVAPAPYRCTTAADLPGFIGWATISHRGCVAPGAPQTADCRVSPAYRWTGSTWQYQAISECGGPRQVYVYPYAAGWSWIWSQQTGWLAVRSNLVHVQATFGLH